MTNRSGQQPLFSGKSGRERDSRRDLARHKYGWLGLNTNHRRVFAALEDGWLRPLPTNAGLLLGVGAYAPEHWDEGRHPISVRLKFDVRKLPSMEVLALRDESWMPCSPKDVGPTDTSALYWPGAIPTFAVSSLEVATAEERARLSGMARLFTNVELPVPVTVGIPEPTDLCVSTPPTKAGVGLAIPHDADAIRGALSMATWAVPRIDPWLDLLVASLSSDQEQLAISATKVEAQWWRFPPWITPCTDKPSEELQDCLWRAAVDVFRDQSERRSNCPAKLAEKIAAAGTHYGCSDVEIADWRRQTNEILRAKSTIRLDVWRDCPVGMAIQLVLTRPEPTRFKKWSQDIPNLPPTVWWSAAALCGLKHGYRKLDVSFRGQAPLQEALSVHALRTSAADLRQLRWPFLSGDPSWRREANGFVLLWGDKEIVHKTHRARGQWYAADYRKKEVVRQAKTVSKRMKWECLHRKIKLPSGRLPISGSGDVSRSGSEIHVDGDVWLQLPPYINIEETLDVESFRHHVVVAAGRLPVPPITPATGVEVQQLNIPGLAYVPNFLSKAEETEVVAEIDQNEWSKELRRRVQHYGWHYGYKARQVDSTMRLGPIPKWAERIAQRLFEQNLVSQLPDQVIVNEYIRDQGISKHVDAESSFADDIAMISLLESWEMVFRNQRGHGRRKKILRMERRSATIIANEARYQWSHEIPKRKSEPAVISKNTRQKRPRIPRERRLSLTFRKVKSEHHKTLGQS